MTLSQYYTPLVAQEEEEDESNDNAGLEGGEKEPLGLDEEIHDTEKMETEEE